MKSRIFSRSASTAESEQHHAVMEGHLHTFPAHCSITDITFYYAFPKKKTKRDPDQYPRAEKTMMLTLTDTVFNRANISFKLTYQS